MRTLGVILIVVGLVAVIWGGISYTRSTTVFEVGSLEVTADEKERIPLSPVLGALALVSGAALLVVGRRRRR